MEKEENKKAIKVFQPMRGVSYRPIDRNDPSVIHPDEPWFGWARDGNISSGKKICEFMDWPGTEKKEEEKKDGGTNDENKDKETTPPGPTDDEAKEEEKPPENEENKPEEK